MSARDRNQVWKYFGIQKRHYSAAGDEVDRIKINAKVVRETLYQPTIEKQSSEENERRRHRLINVAASLNMVVKTPIRRYRYNRHGANADSDSYTVQTGVRFKVSNIQKNAGSKEKAFNIQNLKNLDKNQKYNENIKERLQDVERKEDINQEWEMCKGTIQEAAEETLKERHRTRINEWFHEECAVITKKK
ncbi:hypothetical protein ILUMI_03741 [Ignelater luminosus]|uniref:Uncharacterized protein n=1 Tax=Ignelater luminosus TaxID=2038154 RepID=A0A8K0DAY9_IGNLU|nr:hypothetical protein ILUMI_03741 [Ignelater luminosus]